MSDPKEDRRLTDAANVLNDFRRQNDTSVGTDEFYCCPCCGHEAAADNFGRYCPMCKADLDEYEGASNE